MTAGSIETVVVCAQASKPYITISAAGTYNVNPAAITAPTKRGQVDVVIDGLTAASSTVLCKALRQLLRAYPITHITAGSGLSFDLQAWLREHRKQL